MKHRMAKITGMMVVILMVSTGASGCEAEDKADPQVSGEKLTRQAYRQQSAAVPYPADRLKDSLERRNLRDRLLRTNVPNKIQYVYLLSFSEPLGYYTIKGKVSSTQSQMTADQLRVDGNCSGCGDIVVTAPGDDGSYGANENGIFFFTTEGVMVTTNLDYIVSDQPLPFNVPELNKKK